MVSSCEFVTFPLVSWVWYLIVSIPDLYTLTYFALQNSLCFAKSLPRTSPQVLYIFSELKSFSVADITIACEETVKLLGVELDYQLNFNEQVSRIRRK